MQKVSGVIRFLELKVSAVIKVFLCRSCLVQ